MDPELSECNRRFSRDKLFEYDSACGLNASSGSMQGRYFFNSEDGESFSVEIPEFYFDRTSSPSLNWSSLKKFLESPQKAVLILCGPF